MSDSFYFQGVLPDYASGCHSRQPNDDPITLDFPTRAPACPAGTVQSLACGHDHALAVVDGQLYGMGSNKYQAIHHSLSVEGGSNVWYPIPAAALPGAEAPPVEVACGMRHSMVRLANGQVFSCGDNQFSQCGHAGRSGRQEMCKWGRVEMDDPATRIFCSQGGNCSFALAGSLLYSWGAQEHGNLGHGTRGEIERTRSGGRDQYADVETPKLVQWFSSKRAQVVSVSAGRTHTVVVGHDGEVYAFGDGTSNKLGNGSLDDELFPRRMVFPASRNLEKLVDAVALDESTIIMKYSQLVGAVFYIAGRDVTAGELSYRTPTRVNATFRIDQPKRLVAGPGHAYVISEMAKVGWEEELKLNGLYPEMQQQQQQQQQQQPGEAAEGNNNKNDEDDAAAAAENSQLGGGSSASNLGIILPPPPTEIYCIGKSLNNPQCSTLGMTGKDRDAKTPIKYVAAMENLSVKHVACMRQAVWWVCDDQRASPARVSLENMVDGNDRQPLQMRRLLHRQKLERLSPEAMNKRADPQFYENQIKLFFEAMFLGEERQKKFFAKSGKKGGAAAAAAAANEDTEQESEEKMNALVAAKVEERVATLPVAAPETSFADVYQKSGNDSLHIGSHVRVWMTNVYALGTITGRDLPGMSKDYFEVTWARDDWEPEAVELKDEDEVLDDLNDNRWQKLWFPTWDESAM